MNRPAQPIMALLLTLLVAGCAHHHPRVSPPPSPPPTTTPPPAPAKAPRTSAPAGPLRLLEEGNASWYGVPYHGRRAANGEIYDMYKMTAAHRTLPFETIVRVTNLKNGKHTDVRITDRGPFVEGRILDLSLGAARDIDMVADGVARVRIEFIAGPNMGGAFTVQVGAFLQKENAVKLRQQLERKYQPVFVFNYDSPKGMYYRVRVGRVPTEEAAKRLASKLQAQETLTTFVVRLDEEE